MFKRGEGRWHSASISIQEVYCSIVSGVAVYKLVESWLCFIQCDMVEVSLSSFILLYIGIECGNIQSEICKKSHKCLQSLTESFDNHGNKQKWKDHICKLILK